MKFKRADDNQAELVRQIRKIPGLSVAHTYTIGKGFPDIVLGWRGKNYLCEVKDPAKYKSGRKLTPDEERFFEQWTGQIAIIETVDDVLNLINQQQ